MFADSENTVSTPTWFADSEEAAKVVKSAEVEASRTYPSSEFTVIQLSVTLDSKTPSTAGNCGAGSGGRAVLVEPANA